MSRDWTQVYITYFENQVTPNKVKKISVANALKCIENGTFKDDVEAYRNAPDKKMKFPAFCWTGWWPKGRGYNKPFEPSGLVFIEQDNDTTLLENPAILASWTSRSGNGRHYIVEVEGICNSNDYKRAWIMVHEMLFGKGDVKADLSVKDATRIAYVSYDSE